jgi:hypothetical protein
MNNLPYELKLHILSYLPIANEKKNILLNIIKNYKYYFISELERLNINIEQNFYKWSKLNNNNETIDYITLLQIQNFYIYCIIKS